MRFRSIQAKHIALVLSCVIASALLIGGVCVKNAVEHSTREAAQNMNLTCESYKQKYDDSLKGVQGAVESSAFFASQTLESVDRFATDGTYRDAYAARLEDMLAIEAHGTDAVSYYVRFSPDLPPSDLPSPDPETANEHAGWYNEPIEQGAIVWLDPYRDADQDRQTISCAAPFYKDGVLVGVVGMDVDFTSLADDLAELRVFDHGFAFLCSPKGEVYYHPLYGQGTFIQQDASGFDAQLEGESSGSVLYKGTSEGESIEYAFRSLTNGMRLVLQAPEAEINADTASLVQTIALLVLGIVAFFTVVTVIVGNRITKPLRELTDAARQISEGDYDISLDVKSRDEVGVLAHTLQMASVALRAHADRLRQLAYKDALTGVRNKAAYDLETSVLDAEIEHTSASFGLVVFDVNDLKSANDLYGHEHGDNVIKVGCMRICKAFPHSPVYRIGGDEFVAVLEGEEVGNMDERLARFEELSRADAEKAQAVRDDADVIDAASIVNVAYGAAIYEKGSDGSVQDVFNRADKAMYEMKEDMKAR